MQYFIDSKDGSLQAAQNCGDKKPFFTVMSTAEFHECKEQLPYYKELLHCLGSIRYCKAEVFKNCIIGTLRLPQKSEQRSPQLSFGFYLTGQSLLFVEDVGDLKLWVDKRIGVLQELNSPAHLLLQFMEQMIEDDVLYLSHIESETEKMEENIGSGGSADFFPLLTKHRQKLSELNAYYEQLTDIGELFQSSACSSFIQDDLYSANVLCRWKTKRMQEKKKKRRSLQKMNSFVPIYCARFHTICGRLLPQFPAMQVIFYQTATPLTKRQRISFIPIFTMTLCGLSIWWKICSRSQESKKDG